MSRPTITTTTLLCSAFLGLSLVSLTANSPAPRPPLRNTQKETTPLLNSSEALTRLTLPPGFKATVFASHPDVHQPIGMAWDARGRLWVAENYTYAEQAVNFDTNVSDQIIILDDTNADGISDRRTVFWSEGKRLTSVAVGFGGVYALCPPQLLFIPDRDGNDIPDGPPVVLLDGWDANAVRHNIANGLKFGPDGWLYGRHGILATSNVGAPGAPPEKRTLLNCAIWRIHPVTRAFEVVAQGTTNPWGHDWDDHGQLFFINTVIGHVWHVLPGAYYRRMYGEHFNTRLYELIEQTADHFHWDTKEGWSDIRRLGVTSTTGQAGGGHAHSGLMIYLGDNWPDEFRHDMFTLNFHGQRLNRDHLQRTGATYSARHAPDLLHSTDPWFRGLDVTYGPDGGVYISDWSDLGECHDQDGIHRTSGRIFKVTFGNPERSESRDLAQLSDAQLIALQGHRNDWFVRAARQVLQERAAQGKNMTAAHADLRRAFTKAEGPSQQLRVLWSLYVTGGADSTWLREQLNHPNEHLRTWAVRLLSDGAAPDTPSWPDLLRLARREQSGLVLSFLASVLSRSEGSQRWELAAALAEKQDFAADRVYPLMVWYGIESAVTSAPDAALKLAGGSRLPKLRRFIARRLTEEMETAPGPVEGLVKTLADDRSSQFQLDVLGGMADALTGWPRATPPPSWASVETRLRQSATLGVRKLAEELSLLFGDGRAAGALRLTVADPKADLVARRKALQALTQNRAGDLLPLLVPLLAELEIAPDAVRALGTLGHAGITDLLLTNYARLRSQSARVEAINTLASRPLFATALLRAIENKQLARSEIAAFQIRQLQSLNDPDISRRVQSLWPELHQLAGAKAEQAERYRQLLGPNPRAHAHLERGRQLYAQTCGACHVLFGEGGAAGPDLTGSDRKNLEYLLSNILDPSGVVPADWRLATITLKDDRVINGVPGATTPKTLTVQTPTEKMVLNRADIASIEHSNLSMMPEGLLEALSPEQVRDLIGYIMSDGK